MHNESQIKEGYPSEEIRQTGQRFISEEHGSQTKARYTGKEIEGVGLAIFVVTFNEAYKDEAKVLEKVEALKSKYIVCASL